MTALVQATADIIVPVLAGGAGAVVSGAADEAGAELYRAVSRVVNRVRHLFAGSDTPSVVSGLTAGLQEGLINENDLRAVAEAHSAYIASVHYSVGSIEAKNSFVGETRIQTFNA
jgi:hypothetical protein